MDRRSSFVRIAFALSASAGCGHAAASDEAFRQDLERSLQPALADVLKRDPASANPRVIERPEQERFELGAVMDVRKPYSDGVPVLAISPGGAAERLGMLVGDRLLSINGIDVAGINNAAERIAEGLVAQDGTVALEIRRGDQQLWFEGKVDVVQIPGYVLTIEPPAATETAAPSP